MAHQPYEAWLLDDARLTPEQERDLRQHLRACPACASLASANLSLRAAPVVGPRPGFALRFQARLLAQRRVQRRRNIFGVILLGLAGAGLLALITLPYWQYFSLSPLQLLLTGLNSMVYFALTARTLGILSTTLFNVLVALVPLSAWAVLPASLAGLTFLWMFSYRRAGKMARVAA